MYGNAQYYIPENQVWAFGDSVLVNFTSGAPIVSISSVRAFEGAASIANSHGELLFYTEGETVHNRLGNVMPSGTSVIPTDFDSYSTTQGAVIVPFLNDTNKYYLFSISYSPWGGIYNVCQLSYSVIDMSLDGGLGDVVPGTANTFLMDSVSEKMIAIAGNNCNIWLLAHRSDSSLFYVYEITKHGISPPLVQNVGLFSATALPFAGNGYHHGAMKCSHDRRSLFLACYQLNSIIERGTGELYDFNPSTGIISNCRQIASEALYSAEFSPDKTKLYATSIDTNLIIQLDLSLSDPAAIKASRTRFTTFSPGPYACQPHSLRLAPDGKIYVAVAGGPYYLNSINHPNAAGTACDYTDSTLNLYPHGTAFSLPNLVWKVQGVADTITGPSNVCIGDSIMLYNSIPGSLWTSSDPLIASVDLVTGKVKGISAGTATITYKVAEGECFAVRYITVNECETAVNTLGNNATINIYPNPVSGSLTIHCPSCTAVSALTLCDVAGRQILSASIPHTSATIDLSPIPPGIYICTISGSSPATIHKIITKQ
ncbi:hypothetical protein GCM10023093_11090 [Nemorincola caseinilytica]|uniref:Secretion system C-terminal sorting domain-containing protein n=2 Tax=Nemorincola caseinilytica TaxID=2054315 RepID=A0ABP8NAH9_9BACT